MEPDHGLSLLVGFGGASSAVDLGAKGQVLMPRVLLVLLQSQITNARFGPLFLLLKYNVWLRASSSEHEAMDQNGFWGICRDGRACPPLRKADGQYDNFCGFVSRLEVPQAG